jgi:glycosyltransferase involved in cell wall biosynthesis
VLHIVVSDAFAGAERYVCNVASETARRGWEVAVVGGDATGMRAALTDAVRWEKGSTLVESMRSVVRLGRWDVCHVQMTAAETVAVATQPVHRAPIVSTRQFAARRGSSLAGRAGAPLIAARIAREIAVSEFIARSIERAPAAVVISGVPPSPPLWSSESRAVLVLQRLEPEKDTLTALEAWRVSRLVEERWSLRVVGGGSQQAMLERWVSTEGVAGVTFTGWTSDVAGELRRAGMVLASAVAEPLGLSVVEAMAAGVPVVASAAGGHLETAGQVPGAQLFPAGNALAGGLALRALRSDRVRARLSTESRRVVAEHLTVERHVDRLLGEYEVARSGANCRGIDPAAASVM